MTGTFDGHWVLDEDSGSTAYDYSGSELHGSISGAGPQGSGTTTGPFGNSAYTFDGNDTVNLGDNATFTTGVFALSAWVRWDGAASGSLTNGAAIISNYGGTAQQYGLRMTQNGLPRVFADDNGSESLGFVTADGVTDISDGSWYHVCGILDGTNLKIFLDGVKEATTSFNLSGSPNPSSATHIGQDGDNQNNDPWTGAIADSRYYTRPLSEPEVHYLYRAGTRSEIVFEPFNNDS